ncbi:hypothetical protein KI688_004995 [Linnemannia hyalina]|uniref:Uncharacterized protein n=1 Tax=Linnemannia hyalina TaxID=64524 RepID=A0A9P7XL90_9FUNG|nr:hypothetical protein KI688_004995 [Linnemannia hyalina]
MRRTYRLLNPITFAKVDENNFVKPTTHFEHGTRKVFWADRAMLVNSAIAAKKSAVMIQEASLQEANSGLQRYPSDLNSNYVDVDIVTEIEAEVTSEIADGDPGEVDVTNEELTRAKLTPFYDLIPYVFKKAFTLAPMIKSESLVPSLSLRLPAIEALLSELLLGLCPGLDKDLYAETMLTGLQAKIRELLGNSVKETGIKAKEQKAVHAVPMSVCHICPSLTTEQFVPPTSEHVFVSTWTHINVLLYGSKIRPIPGELVSTAARYFRLVVEEEFGTDE